MLQKYQEKYKAEIANKLQSKADSTFLYWKGRVALFAFLKSLHLSTNDEIIIPAFTCVVVPNAILYAGLKPVYVEISADTYNIDITKLEAAITDKTKVIICQNTFGLCSNLEEILSIAKKYKIYTVEDCTHGFGGFYKGKPNGSYCDAAFFSTQWNKPFSTGIGGFLVVNHPFLVDSVRQLEFSKIKPSVKEKTELLFLLIFKKLFLNKFTYSTFVKTYRVFSKYNIVVGSNEGRELDSTIMPKNYFKDISYIQIIAGLINIKKIDAVNELRKKNASEYNSFLKSKNKTFVNEQIFNDHLFLKFPLLVKDRTKFFELAEKANINLGDWFLSPIHPVLSNLERWRFDCSLYPLADSISRKIVNLPTEIKANSNVIKFLEENIDLIA